MERAPIIDRETIDMLREMDAITEDDLLIELIDDFLNHSAGIMTEIQTSAAVLDYRKLAASAHSLKGASLNIGVLGLFTICDQIETLARTLTADGAQAGPSREESPRGPESMQAMTHYVAELAPTYQLTATALAALRDRTSRGEAIDDLLCSPAT